LKPSGELFFLEQAWQGQHLLKHALTLARLVQAVRFFRVELLFSALSRCPKEGDIGITPPFVKNCTLSREPEVRDVRPIRGQDYIIEQLASVA
jgi:hypothetical protein